MFTLPSSAEAFGNVFAEALASGLPIIGSSIGGIPDLVEHGTNGLLVKPGNIEALAGAIRYLADDPELRQEMAQRNRAKAEANLEWSHVTRRYLATYEAIQNRRSCRRAGRRTHRERLMNSVPFWLTVDAAAHFRRAEAGQLLCR